MYKFKRNGGKTYFSVKGVRSEVLTYNSVKNDDTEGIGHITMLDIEDTDLETVKNMVNNMFDVAFILESSRDGYHVYNPVIRSFEDTRALMKSIALEDSQHVSIGYKRGDWVLRMTDKPAEDKQIPHIVYETVSPTKRKTLSKPHVMLIAEYFNSSVANDVLDKMPVNGKSVEIVEYWTFK